MNNGRKYTIASRVLYIATGAMAILLIFSLATLEPSVAISTVLQVLLWWSGVSGSVLAMYGAVNIIDKRRGGGEG